MDEEIDLLVKWQTSVLKPKAADKSMRDCVVCAVDSEYKLPFVFPTPDAYEAKHGVSYPRESEGFFQPKEPFLTYQFAVQNFEGHIVTQGVKWDPPITRKQFLEELRKFLDKSGVEWGGKRVVVAAHVSRMELQHLTPLPRIKDYGDESWESWLDKNTVVIDTAKLFGPRVSLATASEGSPFEKVSLEGFRGKPETHWRANPNLLYDEDQAKFWEYARGDSAALLWRLSDLRNFVWTKFHIDLLRVHSAAGLSTRILQSRISEPLEPAKREQFLDSRERVRTRVVFDPELIECRRTALRSYAGGRREAYAQGLIPGPVYVYDFMKQYTVATLATPLPTASTKIVRMRNLEDCARMVGWARVRFKFPPGTAPCIGVKEPRFPKLVFVREGETWTGVFSIRRALQKGAEIEFIEGWGFTPTPNEQNNPLHEYFRELLEIGKQLSGFYELFCKNLANSLIGRMIAKIEVDDERPEDVWVKTPRRVMASFCPSYPTLILDHARTLEDQLIDLAPRMVYSHTDSAITRDPINLQHPFIEYIRTLGGDVKLEMTAPYAWVLRAAVAYLPNLDPNGRPKAPHHAIDCQKPDYIRTAQHMLEHPELTPRFAKIRYITLKEHKKKRTPLAAYRIHGMQSRLEWDYKRKPLGEPLTGSSLWTTHIESETWQSVDEILETFKSKGSKQTASTLAKRLTGRVGRPRVVSEEQKMEIHALARSGRSPSEIAKKKSA